MPASSPIRSIVSSGAESYLSIPWIPFRLIINLASDVTYIHLAQPTNGMGFLNMLVVSLAVDLVVWGLLIMADHSTRPVAKPRES